MSGHTIRWETLTLNAEADRRFRRICIGVGLLLLTLAIVVSLIQVSGVKRGGGSFTNGQYVQLLPPQPPAPLAKKREIPKPQKKVQKKPPEQAKPRVVKKKVKPTHRVVTKSHPKVHHAVKPRLTARQKAQRLLNNSGLDQLSDLRSHNLPAINGSQRLRSGRLTSKGSVSGGDVVAQQEIDKSATAVSQNVSGAGAGTVTRQLSGKGVGTRRTARVHSPTGFGNHPKRGLNGNKSVNGRTLQEIQLVFDRNKGAFYALYNRALRQSPGEQGKVVVSLTIAPSGRVTACHLVYSDLGDTNLERQIVARVKMMNFGRKDVPSFTYPNYPIHFVPPS